MNRIEIALVVVCIILTTLLFSKSGDVMRRNRSRYEVIAEEPVYSSRIKLR
ncbi:hypothetical protein [Serratia rubidaea]|uniref:hypothetical protein n=1 Tax=Serratia rubidaea TaxID=61652 RepID=UPI000AC49068|nr:hypothetical protein [Serratia rubidaea]QPR63032.1 hypothetical protein I6G83_19885 [Serratia rubidaea]WBF47391.1 hypothetical protein OLD77_10200 [Serratia rubidaea]HAY0636460.1 hypothetical protein [Serratia rubidaea]